MTVSFIYINYLDILDSLMPEEKFSFFDEFLFKKNICFDSKMMNSFYSRTKDDLIKTEILFKKCFVAPEMSSHNQFRKPRTAQVFYDHKVTER